MTITKRFWIALIFSLPMLAEMILKPFGWMMPGGEWTMFVLTTIVMIVAAGPFINSAWASFKKHHSGHPSGDRNDHGIRLQHLRHGNSSAGVL